MADKKFDKINSVEALEAKLVEIRAAEEVWATFPQEKVDAICEAAAMAADKMRIPLAKMAHEETKAGIVVEQDHQEQLRCRTCVEPYASC